MNENIRIKTYDIKNKIDYLLVYLLISLSGNNVFGEIALLITFFLSFFLFLYRKKQIDRIFLYFMLLLTVILLLQTIKFDFYPWRTIAGVYVRILVAYFIIKSVGETFIEKYINIFIVISLMSIVFYVMINIIPGLSSQLQDHALYVSEGIAKRYYLGIGTIISGEYVNQMHRNHGPFWEAGAFAGYLMIAIIFNTIKTGQLFNKAGILLMITLLTTQSTTSYVALFVLFIFYMMTIKKYKFIKLLIIPFIIIVGYIAFYNLDFLGQKIENKLTLAQDPSQMVTGESSRFLDAKRDFKSLQGHELIGRGGNKETRYNRHGHMTSTNGATDVLVEYGFIFIIIIIFLLYKSQLAIVRYYHNLHKIFAIYMIIIIFLLLQSETYFGYPLFWGLLFLYPVYKNKKENNVIYNHTSV